MKIQRNKSAVIALVLTLIAATFVALPGVSAHDPAWNVPTFPFLVVSPSPVGIGQTVTVNMWLTSVIPTAYWQHGDRYIGFTVEVTKPDGSMETLGPFTADDISGAWTYYTPTSVGTYYFQFFYPGQVIAGINPAPTGTRNPEHVGDYHMPSNTPKMPLVVTQEPLEARPATPLPTDYWTRPINGMNPEWARIAGDWLGVDPGRASYNAYCTGPESGHVMWTRPLAFAGVVGGIQAEYDWNYYTGMAYETKFGSVLIMNGLLYYRLPMGTSGSGGGTDCVDLRTGELLWHKDDLNGFSFGQNYDYVSPNEFGVKPYLWTTGGRAYTAYDPMTGEQLFTIENATTGTTTFGPHGELMVYTLNGNNDWLLLWNSTKCIISYQASNEWMWRPQGRTMDWERGIEWNVTTNHYAQSPGASQGITAIDVDAGVILADTYGSYGPIQYTMEIGYSTVDGHEMWVVNRTAPFEGGTIQWVTIQGGAGEGVFCEWYQEKMVWYGYDITTGKQIWGPTEPYAHDWGMYGWQARIMYGMLIANDFAGYVHAYDIHTGELQWEYFAGSAGWDTPYGIYPSEMPIFGADGKIYVSHGHGYSPPIFKGATLTCIDATDGTEIWKELQFNNRAGFAIADGYVIVYNLYDGLVYCFGKGPSATTVTAGPKVTTLGSSVMIEGMVTDECAGAKGLVEEGKFKSVSAISDEDQSPWMEYLYQQQPIPTNAKGVEVTLDAIDPNGNWIPIGTVTSDMSGLFKKMWTPETEGEYTIIATFAGSKSYGSSYAETAIGVSAAPSPAVPIEPEPTEPTEAPFITTELAIIAAVAVASIIGIAAFWFLRKRK